jgi:hypothetical protein
MMRLLFLFFLGLFPACSAGPQLTPSSAGNRPPLIKAEGTTLAQRFAAPEPYRRVPPEAGSFGAWLRQRPLRPQGSLVHHYDGTIKANKAAYCAVLDIDIGTQDLQQCADAVMRLRAEYLYEQKDWAALGFRFVQDGKMHYFREESTDRSYPAFRKWLNRVFAYANTRSLQAQLKPKEMRDMVPGDVLIQAGTPYGHAVIVMDMAVDPTSGEKLFMLAQSYMPAQDIQVLVNPNEPGLSPWYRLSAAGQGLHTPEWDFNAGDLRAF